jgi:glutamate-1-semialdehyde 2,1-aminomutase
LLYQRLVMLFVLVTGVLNGYSCLFAMGLGRSVRWHQERCRGYRYQSTLNNRLTKMEPTWELRDYDQAFFERELASFVPDRIFDSHAHLYEVTHWRSPSPFVDKGPSVVTMEEFQRQMQWITPGRITSGLFFGGGLTEESYEASNRFVATEVAKDERSRGQLIVSPRQDPEQVREAVRQYRFVGLKVYHTFSPRKPSWDSEVREYLTEEHVRVAHEEGLSITLHMVRARAVADPLNQEQIRNYCRKYSNIRMILAHAARGFNPYHTIEGIQTLKGLGNVWCDASAVTEAGGFEAIIQTLGHERLMWGSDFPISHFRGRCVAVGDEFLWLHENTLDWDTVAGYAKIRPLFVAHESLRALKLAAMRLRLSDSQIEDIFCHNGKRLFGV